MLTRGSAGPVARLAGCVALALLAGHPQYVVLAVMFAVLFRAAGGAAAGLAATRARSVGAGPNWRHGGGAAISLGAGLAFAAAIAAAQLLPTDELSKLSERVWAYPNPVDPALRWIFLLALFTPRHYNHLSNSLGQPLGYSELGLYCGVLTFVLFLIGAVGILRRRKPLELALLLTWGLAMLYSLGDEGGIARPVMRLVPLLGASRGAARGLAFATVAYVLVAGHGLAAASGFVAALRDGRRVGAAWIWGSAALLVLAGDLALTHREELQRRLVPTRLLRMRVPSLDHFTLPPESAPRIHRFMANDSDLYLDQRGDAVLQRRFRLQPNLNALESLRLTDGYEEGLLPPRHYANFLRRFNRNLRSDKPDAALLALMGVGGIMTEYPISDMGRGWELDGPAAYYFGITYRFFRPATGAAAPWFLDADALGPAVREDWDAGWWGATVMRTPGGAKAREPAGRAGPVGHPGDWITSATLLRAAAAADVRIAELRTNSLLVESPSAKGRHLLLLQSWYPAWRVRTDGAAMPLGLAAKSPVFSEFEWQEGVRRMELEYRPFSFLLGLFMTLATAGGWIAVLAEAAMRRWQ